MTRANLALLQSQLDALPLDPPTVERLEALNVLASFYKTFDPLQALNLAVEALAVAQALQAGKQEARAWAIRAYAALQNQEIKPAYQYARNALALLSKDEDDLITAGYSYFVVTCFRLYDVTHDRALDAGLRAFDLLDRADDRFAQGNVANILTVAYSRLGDCDKAEKYGTISRALYQALEEPSGEALALNNLAMHYFNHRQLTKAREMGEAALSLLRELLAKGARFHFFHLPAAVLHTLSDITLAQEDYAAAECYLEEGLALLEGDDYATRRRDAGFLGLSLGKLLFARGDLPQARRALVRALWFARSNLFTMLIAETAETLARLYEAMGSHRRALQYFRMHFNIEKKRYATDLASKMHKLEIEHEVQAARREAELLAEKNHQIELAYAELRLANDALQAANTTIRDLSLRDGLTMLFNRQHFEEWAEERFAAAHHDGHAFSVMLCDIDNFKTINDSYLHHSGDAVLKRLAQELEAICPPEGKAARYGGEEFVLAVPNCTRDQLHMIAEDFRHRIETMTWSTIHPNLHVTISVGVVENKEYPSLSQQLIQADRYLYAAKHQGKNRVVCADTMRPARIA